MDICWAPILFLMIKKNKHDFLFFAYLRRRRYDILIYWCSLYSVLATCNLKGYLYLVSFLFVCNTLVTRGPVGDSSGHEVGKIKSRRYAAVEELDGEGSAIREVVSAAVSGVPSVWWAHGHTTFYIY